MPESELPFLQGEVMILWWLGAKRMAKTCQVTKLCHFGKMAKLLRGNQYVVSR